MGLAVSWMIFAVALTVSLLVVFFTHRAIVRPISKLVAGTQVLATGDLSGRLDAPLRGEFRVLAESFNSMAEALERNQRQLVEAEKLATMGRFSAGIAHEINNPIAVILGYTKTMRDRGPEGSTDKEALAAIEEEAQHCKGIVRALLDLARPAKEESPETVDVNDVVSEALGVARVLQLTPNVNIETEIVPKPIPLTIRRSTLRQILLNIITNALEAMQETGGGRLRIEGFVRNGPEGVELQGEASDDLRKRFLVLRVADTGPGIPRENMHLLFEPFFTTKKSGTGLGLAITYSIVDANGGHIVVATAEGEGTTFTISLPLMEGEASPSKA